MREGVSKSLQPFFLQTDAPFVRIFAELNRGGIPTKVDLCKNIRRIPLLKPILFCWIVPKYEEKTCKKQHKSYSSIHTIRGVLRPAFQMAVDDDILVKNPFGFQLAGVLVNDAVTREVIYKDQMRKFLKFVHDDVAYCKYYEVVYILFHTGMRISEFCGLTLKDIDLEKMTVNIDHQLQRTSDMRYIIETTKTDAGTRVLPITEDVAEMFQAIIEDRNASKVEKDIDGYSGFLFYDDNGMPLVAMHWQHRFNHMVGRYNDIYRVQMPNITLHGRVIIRTS